MLKFNLVQFLKNTQLFGERCCAWNLCCSQRATFCGNVMMIITLLICIVLLFIVQAYNVFNKIGDCDTLCTMKKQAQQFGLPWDSTCDENCGKCYSKIGTVPYCVYYVRNGTSINIIGSYYCRNSKISTNIVTFDLSYNLIA